MSNLLSNLLRRTIRTLALSAFASALLASPALAQQQTPPKPAKKKLQASSNFTQYAGRDASNRLIAGGATRGTISDEATQISQKGQDAYEVVPVGPIKQGQVYYKQQ